MSRRGAHAEARPLAEAVLQAEPNFPDAVMVLAAADAAEGAAERAQRRLELLAGDQRLTPQQRALAQGQLGDVLDMRNLPDEAFQAYVACNMALWRVYSPVHGQGPGAADFARAMLDELAAIPTDAWTSSPPPSEGGPKAHVFLMGFPRSGTTLLEQVLASHPDVEALEERETLVDAQRAFLRDPGIWPAWRGRGRPSSRPCATPTGRASAPKEPTPTARCSSTSIRSTPSACR